MVKNSSSRVLLTLLSVWLLAAACLASLQELFVDPSFYNFLEWDTLSTTSFNSFIHPNIPDATLRIKKHNDFCDATVRSYTGYLDVAHGTQHLFFYFFESRHDPQTDPVILWLNGGPGCSSTTGLFMELGPCQVALDGNSTSFNKYSWNEQANVIFLDQPVGVGYSYSEYGAQVETTEEAAPAVLQFISLFFETFSKFKGRPFHITGESYGGRYIPVFASAILDYNVKLNSSEHELALINLTSVAIGNGMTNAVKMMPTRHDMLCTSASLPPVVSISECVEMKRKMPLCVKRLRLDCEETHDAIACEAAMDFLSKHLRGTTLQFWEEPLRPVEGYEIEPAIEKYLNLPSTRSKLGIPPAFPPFLGCSASVNRGFATRGDLQVTSEHHLAQLLERGVKVLLYDGVLDLYCNKIGYLRLAESIEWSGQAEFIRQEMRPWTAGSDNHVAGQTKIVRAENGSGGALAWAEVDGAGHMVPYDKPLESLVMIQRWLAGEDL